MARYTREELTLLLGGFDVAQTRPRAPHEVSADAVRRGVFETLMAEEHYLGYRSAVGENLKYLLCQEDGRPLEAWLFGAAAWRCEARVVGSDGASRNVSGGFPASRTTPGSWSRRG